MTAARKAGARRSRARLRPNQGAPASPFAVPFTSYLTFHTSFPNKIRCASCAAEQKKINGQQYTSKRRKKTKEAQAAGRSANVCQALKLTARRGDNAVGILKDLRVSGVSLVRLGLTKADKQKLIKIYETEPKEPISGLELKKGTKSPRMMTKEQANDKIMACKGVQKFTETILPLIGYEGKMSPDLCTTKHTVILTSEGVQEQWAHTDEVKEGGLQSVIDRMRVFPVNIVVPVPGGACLGVRTMEMGTGCSRVKIEGGHCLLFRGGVAHRGVECTGADSHRLHMCVTPFYWVELLHRGQTGTHRGVEQFPSPPSD